ncbi:MAG: YitT family protein [Bacteroidales bacterium]|nr:YitT family protein [Candidatus Cacconaster caballi]
MNSKKIFSSIKSYAIITLGLIIYTTAWTVFIIPNGLVGGGITGISAIIQYCTGFPVSYSYFLLNAVLLLIALKVLGYGFGVKTIFAMVVTTILLKVMPALIQPEFIEEIALRNGRLVCAIIGGGLSGFGVSLTFGQGGSSGGTDIIALMINKYRAISPGKIILYIDIFIIASSLITPGDGTWASRIATVIYGYVTAGVFSVTMDIVTSGSKQSVQIFIFSKKHVQIADRISSQMHRGVTVLDGQGWYTKEQSRILMVITRKTDTNSILNLIKEEDPQAFISVGSVMGVYGKGFEQIKK